MDDEDLVNARWSGSTNEMRSRKFQLGLSNPFNPTVQIDVDQWMRLGWIEVVRARQVDEELGF